MQTAELERFIAALVGELLDLNPESIDTSHHLERYGIDSVTSLSIVEALERHLGRELDPALLVTHPTIHGLACRLTAQP
jgi:acyl carrier protein